MDDARRLALVEERGILILPEDISAETYELVLEAMMLRPSAEIRMYCRGDGGESRAEIAIVDLVCQHGNVTGILPGSALSAHAIIFAACARRYVYPNATIGLHRVAVGEVRTRVDSVYAVLLYQELVRADELASIVLARACTDASATPAYWRKEIREAGSGAYSILDYDWMVGTLGMARPISELPPLEAR